MARASLGTAGRTGIAVALLLLLVLPPNLVGSGTGRATLGGGAVPMGPPVPGRPMPLAGATPFNTTLTVNTSSVNLSGFFWGTTVTNEVHMLRGESDAVNATPSRVLVWPGAQAGDDYDPFTDTHYDQYNAVGTHALTNESQFVQMCRATRCLAIMQVPAEINDPAFAARVVNYTETNLSFRPAFWMIGNEPELWIHWGQPWSQWLNGGYTTGPTPTQFGQEIIAYVKAIRTIDNSTPILGLPASGCTCGSWTFPQWISAVLNVTGPLIQAVAFHEYPAGWLGTGDGSLGDFYGTLQTPANIPIRMAAARQAANASCPKCNVSVFISELGAALSWSAYGQYAAGFSGALSIASQITQGMDVNLTNVDLFATELDTTNSWFNVSGYARPDYALYSQILSHLGPRAYAVSLPGLYKTLYGIDTIAPKDGGRQDLLVMNDNINRSIEFAPHFAGNYSGAPVEVWSWNGSIHKTAGNFTTWVEPFTPNPVPTFYPFGLPADYVLPQQALVLFESYPSGGTSVQVNETGLPNGTSWYAEVGPTWHQSTASNFSLLEPAGWYPMNAAGVPLPIGGREHHPSEQLGPWVASPQHFSGSYSNVTVRYGPQWRTKLLPTPAAGGAIAPYVGFWNSSQPLNVTATSNPGYAFEGWTGFGPGSFNGSSRTITVVPTGPIVEKARFVPGTEIDLTESGLPAGTPWAVTVRSYTSDGSGPVIPVYEPNGTYGFQVTPVAGYRVVPRDGSFTVGGVRASVGIRFVPIDPPGLRFPVSFEVTGLPGSMTVPITVRSATQLAILPGGPGPVFQLLNGSYAYHVGYVAGFHAAVPLKMFVVTGGPLTVIVPFVPTVYGAAWTATGERAGMNWSVLLNGGAISVNSSWAVTSLPNGSYSYRIVLPPDFSTTPRTGTITISGSPSRIFLLFELLTFPASFSAQGLPADTSWAVRLGNRTQSTTDGISNFLAANGTYTFDVHAPAGYYASPTNGTLTVAGAMRPLSIQFLPSSERPSAALVAALTSGAVTVSLWIAGAGFVGYAVVRWTRRRGP